MSEYQEHDKMAAVRLEAQAIGEFLENLSNLRLILVDKDGDGFGRLFPTTRSLDQILADHFDIDLKKIEKEKRQMLDEARTRIDLSNNGAPE